MLKDAQRAELIAQLRAFPAELETLIRPFTPAQIEAHPPGEWNTRQIVHHLADSHMNAYIRVRLAITEDHPTLKPYDQDVWAALPDVASVPLEKSLSILRGLHARWAALFEALTPDQYERTAFHPENGVMKVESFLVDYVEHGKGHLRQIQEAVATA